MKALLIIFILLTSLFAANNAQKQDGQNRLCKLFTMKAKIYKKNMRNDEYAYKTLQSYEQRANEFCKKR